MAPTPTLAWVIPAQTVRFVASIVGNSTLSRNKARDDQIDTFTSIMAAIFFAGSVFAIFFAGSVFGYFVAFMNFLDGRSMRKESSEKEVSEKDLLMDIEVREKGVSEGK